MASLAAAIDVDAEEGAQLVIVVDGFDEGAEGQFQLRVSQL